MEVVPVYPSCSLHPKAGRERDTSTGPAELRQQLRHQFAVHVRQPEVAALEAEREPFVIEAEQVQNGRLEIVDVNAVFGGGEAELIRGTDADAGFDAAAGQPDGL